jgi:hypothetical protein
LDFLKAAGVEYVVALGSNARLTKRVRRLLGRARQQHRATGVAVALFGETRYAAWRWSHRRRVIMKAEVVIHAGRPPKNNPRFVVTNLALTPAHVYKVYRERGDMENRITELKLGLALDRTSCTRFQANAFRVLLTVAAYVWGSCLSPRSGVISPSHAGRAHRPGGLRRRAPTLRRSGWRERAPVS